MCRPPPRVFNSGIALNEFSFIFVFRFNANGKQWQVATPNFEQDRWHNVEISWKEDKGIQVMFFSRLLVYSRFHLVQVISRLAKFNCGEIIT